MTLAPPTWQFTSGNPATVYMFNTKDEAEFVTLGPWELSPDRQSDGRLSSEKAREMIETAMREGSHCFEWMHRRCTGETFPATVLLTRMEIDGQAQLQATVRDISQQKQAEEALRASEERFRTVTEAIPQMVWTATPDGALDYVNGRAVIFFEQPDNVIIGWGWEGLLHPDDLPRCLGKWLRSLQTGEPYETEFRLRRADGVYRWHIARALPVRNSSGMILKWFGTCTDITERKHLQNRLELTQYAVDHAVDQIFVVDTDGRILDANNSACRRLGYTKQELLALNMTDIEKDLSHFAWKTYCHELANKKFLYREAQHRGKFGEQYPVEVAANYLLHDGCEVTYVSVRDISAHKVAELNLRQAKEMAETATKAKTAFLANMSHEIRTPMNAIMGMADLLSDTALTEEQGKYVRIFRQAGQNLLVLLNNILDLSRVEANRLTLEQIVFSVSDILDRVKELMVEKAEGKGVELVCYVSSALPGTFIGDPVRFQQIVTNLVSNAIKFTTQGTVTIRLEPDPDQTGPGAVLLTVTDTGVGIASERLKDIFSPFMQADSSTVREYGGAGLGLAICKELAALMGGRLWAESRLGKGSIFSCALQFGLVPQENTDDYKPTQSFSDKHVLVVDDNPTNRLIVVEALTAWKMRVQEMPDGQTALFELIRARKEGDPYTLLLLDSRMPHMDGFKVATQIKMDPLLQDLDIIMLTSDSMGGRACSGEVDRTYREKLAGYVEKPFTREQLYRGILAAQRRRQGLSPVPSQDDLSHVTVPAKPLRILVADDSEDNRFLIQAYLKGTPYHIDYVADGQAAYEKATRSYYEVILMDMHMPIMDGYAATQAIRQWESDHGGAPMMILALTASATIQDAQRAMAAGCTAHLAKPIKKGVLLQAITTYSNTAWTPTSEDSHRPLRTKIA